MPSSPAGTHEGLLTPIQTARFDADNILTKLEGGPTTK
jgi:hypothetical protein